MENKFKLLLALLLLVFGLSLGGIFLQGVSAATRDLVFDDEEEETDKVAKEAESAGIKNPEVISFKTTLDLTKDGETSSVPLSHEFVSGDKIKLRYTTNADGYAYWLAKMASGQYSILFPSSATGMDNFVKKNENHSVPIKGYFRFDDTPGTETIMVVFSTNKIPELDAAVAEAAAEAGKVEKNSAEIANLESETTTKRTTRDLVFDDEEEEEVNTKTQAGEAGEPFVAFYELKHK
ncbi:MAG: DUF4384 domain-containing protein [Deltaproteobacteria bacterium]|jgi:hypothetical protein|nr:DUF4384 domain-containing protein [Deltaproteobacteria bacterium]